MQDERFSVLATLAMECSFEVDFEEVIDTFANNHKNSRIMFRYGLFFLSLKYIQAYVILQHASIQLEDFIFETVRVFVTLSMLVKIGWAEPTPAKNPGIVSTWHVELM